MNPIAKRTVTALTVAAIVVCAVIFAPLAAIIPVVTVLGLLAFAEFAQLLAKRLVPFSGKYMASLAAGLVILACAFAVIPVIAYDHGNLRLLYVLAIVKISDMGGFAFGVAFGRHKMCPTISPNKSWEGLFGSIFASCLVSCCFMGATGFGVVKSLVCGVTAALVGTAGDLVESKFKRWVGVKDSSTMKITNGMGGFLDMIDSLLFAPAVLYFLMGLDF